MIREWIAGRLDQVAAGIDASIPEHELHTFLADRLASDTFPRQLPDSVLYSVACQHAAAIDLCAPRQMIPQDQFRQILPAQQDCLRWQLLLKDEKIARWRGVRPGTGAFILAMFLDGAADDGEFIEWMEVLLRHVEVRRKAGLMLLPEGRLDQGFLERSQVAYLFSRAGMRWNDLRFLNAALKLNDWSFPHFRRVAVDSSSWWYILSLAGAEAALGSVLC
ncbi:MAG: hypothetical protein JXA97_06305 [Anaerolineales bacterium]|nr:hypothetical protein [Anaerolineales bacterium]